MKKRFLFLTLGAMLVTALALNALNVSMNLSANSAERSVMLANVEALAEGEGLPTNATDCAAQQGNWNEASHCIRTGFESVVCKFNGKIVAFGVELSGAYEKGKKYNIPWAEYSCVASTGNCCVKQGLYSGETKLA